MRIEIFALCLHCPNQDKERCLSGRKEQFAKLSYWKRYRGFESRSLRQSKMNPDVSRVLSFIAQASLAWAKVYKRQNRLTKGAQIHFALKPPSWDGCGFVCGDWATQPIPLSPRTLQSKGWSFFYLSAFTNRLLRDENTQGSIQRRFRVESGIAAQPIPLSDGDGSSQPQKQFIPKTKKPISLLKEQSINYDK